VVIFLNIHIIEKPLQSQFIKTMGMTSSEITELNKTYSKASPSETMQFCASRYAGATTLSSSLGAEDQLLTHIIATEKIPVSVFTLDTGRLYAETYSLMERTREKYALPITVYFPDALQVETMVNNKGVNLFYESIENRKLCCHVRKMEPLKRALKGMDCWITGLRREQSEFRSEMQLFEWDEAFNILKVNPLINFTEEDVWQFIRKNHVPYNTLHDKNYKSIGCAPCTRAVHDGDDARSGRWWWEDAGHKECGLHERE
jgi:phosphoadenosine phosphosulfate reductase